jgi:superfamily II DNA or RNA helicase
MTEKKTDIGQKSAPKMTVAADCLLENISRELEEALKKRLTIDNPEYLAAKKYGRWIGKKMKPQLKYYESVPRGLRFPRGFSNQAVLLCREIGGHDPEIIDRRRLLPEVDYEFHGLLRPYQRRAVAAISRHSFGVLEAGTGSGKTVMALAVIAARRQPALVVVHTKELLYQWRQRAEEYLRCPVGILGDGKADIQALTIAIVNSARKRVTELAPLFGHLVVDECHRVPASLFTDVVSAFDSYYELGLSATAFRRDRGMTQLIYFFMGDRVHKVDQEELAATGAIVRPELIRRPTSFTFNYQGDYQAMIKALVVHQGRNRQILDDIVREAARPGGGIALVVSDRVSHCRFFAEHLAAHGLQVALLTGQQTPEQRATVVAQVQQGELQVLVATIQLIGEGFDCPGLTSLFLTTPITFAGRLLQIIGRIMRPAEGKRARVFDYADEAVPALRRSAWNRRQVLEEAEDRKQMTEDRFIK